MGYRAGFSSPAEEKGWATPWRFIRGLGRRCTPYGWEFTVPVLDVWDELGRCAAAMTWDWPSR